MLFFLSITLQGMPEVQKQEYLKTQEVNKKIIDEATEGISSVCFTLNAELSL